MGDKLKTDAKNSLEKVKQFIVQGSFTKQLAAGTASGCVTGAVLSHVGKTVAAGIGCTILIVQIAQYKGLIKSDWKELKEHAEQKSVQYGGKYGTSGPAMYSKVKTFASKNKNFTAGFIGGFLLGISF